MTLPNYLPLALGLVIFSFTITGLLVIPFINLLYKLEFTRRKEAPKKGKVPLFDKLHDVKAGTPVGGGILLIAIVTLFFSIIFPFASHMGVLIRSAFSFKTEFWLILFTMLSFGFLGLLDDLMKIFGKPRSGVLGRVFGISGKTKFAIQWVLGLVIGYIIFNHLGVEIIHIPLIDKTWDWVYSFCCLCNCLFFKCF